MKSFLKNSKKNIVTAFLVVAVVAISTAQAAKPIPLGTAASFAVLGGSGVTCADAATLITGDVGSSPTASVTGITSGMVTGNLYIIADDVTASAHDDLQAAYNAAAATTGGVAGPANLGGTTLVPGVYTYGVAATWSGAGSTLTLDANGDPDAQWIFQIGTELTTPANATVSLINGALANNVYWQVGTSLTLGANNAFAGNILADQSIDLGGGTLNGRALAINAAVTISVATTVTAPDSATLNILWRNTDTGANGFWYMNGATYIGDAMIDTVVDTNWTIVGTDDFDGDSNSDILWRNTETGANGIWYMDGATYLGDAMIDSVVDTNWTIVGTYEYGDGVYDILWRNTDTGANGFWYMNGAIHTGGEMIDSVVDQNWTVVGGTK